MTLSTLAALYALIWPYSKKGLCLFLKSYDLFQLAVI